MSHPSALTALITIGLSAAAIGTAFTANFQTYQAAKTVLGQPDFNTVALVDGLDNRFSNPCAIVTDPRTGKVFVADSGHHRVLRFSSAEAAKNGAQPEKVFGQANFTGQSPNQGLAAPNATTMSGPQGLFIDSTGRLWVADTGNHRVLGFLLASDLGTDPVADVVLGQANAGTSIPAAGNAGMTAPSGVCLGSGDTLWVADTGNHRVLRFDTVSSKISGAAATGVLGQIDFAGIAAAGGNGGMNSPFDVFADAAGRLWVADSGNHRVLRFENALNKNAPAIAEGILGQTNFTDTGAGAGSTKFNAPAGVYGDAAGVLWVADNGNHRVLRFPLAASLTNVGAADLVLGQPDFFTTTGAASAQRLGAAFHLAGDLAGNLLVADPANHRTLAFSPAAPVSRTFHPIVKIKGRKKITTTKAKLILKGTATSIGGSLARVEVRAGKTKPYRSAKGTAAWKFTARLKPGKNVLFARAIDASGATSATVKVTVTRK